MTLGDVKSMLLLYWEVTGIIYVVGAALSEVDINTSSMGFNSLFLQKADSCNMNHALSCQTEKPWGMYC